MTLIQRLLGKKPIDSLSDSEFQPAEKRFFQIPVKSERSQPKTPVRVTTVLFHDAKAMLHDKRKNHDIRYVDIAEFLGIGMTTLKLIRKSSNVSEYHRLRTIEKENK